MFIAEEVSNYLQDMRGTSTEKGRQVIPVLGVYGELVTKHNFKTFFNNHDLFGTVIQFPSRVEVVINGVSYSGKYNINEFITLCRINNVTLEWNPDLYRTQLFLKYGSRRRLVNTD